MKRVMVVVVLMLGLGVAAPASAQVGFGVSAGPVIPVGHLADDVNTGFHAQGSLLFSPIMLPVGVRADILYASFPEKDDDDRATALAGNLNAVLGLGGFGFRPYLIAGLGVYNTSGEHGDDTTELGVNVGGGFEFALGGLGAFVEARYHHGFDDGEHVRFIPISIGIRF